MRAHDSNNSFCFLSHAAGPLLFINPIQTLTTLLFSFSESFSFSLPFTIPTHPLLCTLSNLFAFSFRYMRIFYSVFWIMCLLTKRFTELTQTHSLEQYIVYQRKRTLIIPLQRKQRSNHCLWTLADVFFHKVFAKWWAFSCVSTSNEWHRTVFSIYLLCECVIMKFERHFIANIVILQRVKGASVIEHIGENEKNEWKLKSSGQISTRTHERDRKWEREKKR